MALPKLPSCPTVSWVDLLSKASTNPLPSLGAWWLGGLLSIIVPVITWNKSKNFYYSMYGKYVEYQQQQVNQMNRNYYNPYGYSTCSWWQFNCRQDQYVYQQQNDGDRQIFIPAWYQFLGGRTEEERRTREGMGLEEFGSSGAIKFVYAWSLILFLALLVYGTHALYNKKSVSHLAILLAVASQFAMLTLVLLPQGVISTEDRELENSPYGWYGQMPVLMVYFSFAVLLFSVFFLLLGAIKFGLEYRFLGGSRMLSGDDDDDDKSDKTSDEDYKEAPYGRENEVSYKAPGRVTSLGTPRVTSLTSHGTPSPSIYKLPLEDDDDKEEEELEPRIIVQHIDRAPRFD